MIQRGIRSEINAVGAVIDRRHVHFLSSHDPYPLPLPDRIERKSAVSSDHFTVQQEIAAVNRSFKAGNALLQKPFVIIVRDKTDLKTLTLHCGRQAVPGSDSPH